MNYGNKIKIYKDTFIDNPEDLNNSEYIIGKITNDTTCQKGWAIIEDAHFTPQVFSVVKHAFKY